MKENSLLKGKSVGFKYPIFDVYKPSSRFKKSQRGLADFNVLVLNADDGLYYEQLCLKSKETPLKLAIVSGKAISFLSILDETA